MAKRNPLVDGAGFALGCMAVIMIANCAVCGGCSLLWMHGAQRAKEIREFHLTGKEHGVNIPPVTNRQTRTENNDDDPRANRNPDR
jgi:hypothetical protein